MFGKIGGNGHDKMVNKIAGYRTLCIVWSTVCKNKSMCTHRPEETVWRGKLWLSLDDEMHLENAFLSALLILQVWWYLRFAVM